MRDRVSDQRQTESGQAQMTDYAELLATKSQELAELTRAFNDKRYKDAFNISLNIHMDMANLACIADELGDLKIVPNRAKYGL
jgi:hypothetical protein